MRILSGLCACLTSSALLFSGSWQSAASSRLLAPNSNIPFGRALLPWLAPSWIAIVIMHIPRLAAAISLAAAYASPGALAASDGTNEAAASARIGSILVSSVAPVPGRPTDAASARAAVLAGNYTRLRHQSRDDCPLGCSSAGTETATWYVYGGLDRLSRACNQTMLLDFALFSQVDDPQSPIAISACMADLELSEGSVSSSDSDSSAACVLDGVQRTEVTSSLELTTSGASSSANAADAAAALRQLQVFSALSGMGCNETIKYASSGKVAVGVYAGSGLASQGLLSSVLEKLSAQVTTDGGVSETLVAQMCSDSSARYSLGVMVNTKGDLGAVQRGLQSWKNSSCVALDAATSTPDWQQVTYLAPSLLQGNSSTNSSSAYLAGRSHRSSRRDDDDGECSTIQAVENDTCTTLAAECGITGDEFTEYNSDSDLCSTLKAGQHVCCSSGTLPDYTPSPDDDGYCYSYTIKTGDTCDYLAAAYDITVEDIDDYNTDTWAWNGCSSLYPDYYICLSSGYPPMPVTRSNAVCGPQVNDTAKVPPGTDLSTLNECALNACCDVWGQCGITEEFCTVSNSTTGAPGTAATDQNGCISNCGTNIIASDFPEETYTIAYFEGFDWSRPCQRNSVANLNTSAYTHVHFSFLTLNADFSINMTDVEDQLPGLQGLPDIKKVVSIGGWTFSTDPSTYTIFRDAVASEDNRQTLINNVINFLNDYNLDGVDWDWEYPSEPDIPDIPAGDKDEASNFFLLLDELKEQMPDGKTVSVTAPASYWYLQYFPIDAISLVVDYLVFMTYDLHGQWDYTNKYATPGCPSADSGLGNCLRSHINFTETVSAMSMITKAGVASNKVILGVSSYGRSFQMTTAGCWTEECTFTGPDSGAYPGPCTDTAGYMSDYEINQILEENDSAQTYWDEASYSSIMVFNDTQWVAYMNDSNKEFRKSIYEGFSFLGTADWAVDLQSDNSDIGDDSDSSASPTYYIDPDIWNAETPSVSAVPGATLVWPPMPLSSTTTITFDPWTTTISYSSLTTLTSTLTDGSESTYPSYIWVSWLTELTIPPGESLAVWWRALRSTDAQLVTTTEIPVWGVSLNASATEGDITLTSSIQPPPFTVTVTP